jgi:PAS domain S-box-containing protein
MSRDAFFTAMSDVTAGSSPIPNVSGNPRPIFDRTAKGINAIMAANGNASTKPGMNNLSALQTLADQTDNIIFLKDKDGRFTFINSAGTRLLGLELEEIIGKSEADLFGPLAGFESWESDHQVLLSRQPHLAEVRWLVDKTEHALPIIKHPLTNEAGDTVGIMAVARLPVSPGLADNPLLPLAAGPTLNQTPAASPSRPAPITYPPPQTETESHNSILSLNRTLLTLQSAIVAVGASLDRKHVFDTLIWEMVHLIQAEDCAAFAWDQAENSIVFQGAYEQSRPRALHQTYSLDNLPLFHQVITDRCPSQMVVDNLRPTLPEHALLRAMGMKTLLLLPMVYHEQVLGLIALAEYQKPRHFSDWEISLAQMLANQAASSIVNARLYEEIEQANEALRVSNEELDAFAHTVAHDLKGPLGLMIGFGEVLLDDRANMSGEELDQYLEIIASSGKKMSGIIDALLLLSTVRKVDVERTFLDISASLLEARYRIELQFESLQPEIIVADALPACWGQDAWVIEVWTNYLSNALKYGGRPPRVEVGATAQADGMIRYWVRDNGPGLTPAQQAKLFTPFTRLSQASVSGHGLGLSIVRRIVEKLGGQVGVDSAVGQGSTFYFTLPGHSDEDRALTG